MRLVDLDLEQDATIVSMEQLDNQTRKKLMVMGLLPNTAITITRIAPFGDPIQVRVRDVSVALRKSTASQIEVEVA